MQNKNVEACVMLIWVSFFDETNLSFNIFKANEKKKLQYQTCVWWAKRKQIKWSPEVQGDDIRGGDFTVQCNSIYMI